MFTELIEIKETARLFFQNARMTTHTSILTLQLQWEPLLGAGRLKWI